MSYLFRPKCMAVVYRLAHIVILQSSMNLFLTLLKTHVFGTLISNVLVTL